MMDEQIKCNGKQEGKWLQIDKANLKAYIKGLSILSNFTSLTWLPLNEFLLCPKQRSFVV